MQWTILDDVVSLVVADVFNASQKMEKTVDTVVGVGFHSPTVEGNATSETRGGRRSTRSQLWNTRNRPLRAEGVRRRPRARPAKEVGRVRRFLARRLAMRVTLSQTSTTATMRSTTFYNQLDRSKEDNNAIDEVNRGDEQKSPSVRPPARTTLTRSIMVKRKLNVLMRSNVTMRTSTSDTTQ